MSEEEKVHQGTDAAFEATEPTQTPEVAPETEEQHPRRKPRKWPIFTALAAMFVAVFFVAFLHWHEMPSFCNAFCHQPMDPYVEGYYSGDMSLSAARHAAVGETCLSCHWTQAKLMDLVHEVVMWVGDGFTDPLPDHAFPHGDKASFVSDEFCGACHDGEYAPTKESATAGRWYDANGVEYDPHNIPEDVAIHMIVGYDGGPITCGDCHSVHKESTLVCATCHDDVFNAETSPEYWVIPDSYLTANADTMGVLDPHSLMQLDIYNDQAFHQTAGADGGPITCTDCHTGGLSVTPVRYGSEPVETTGENVFICAACHYSDYKDLIPEGWTVPDQIVDVPMMGSSSSEESSSSTADTSTTSSSTSVDLSSVPDGTYHGEAQGIESTIEVDVTVKDGKITDVQATGDETPALGGVALEEIPDAIVAAGTTEGVDGHSGATITSDAIFEAINKALASATA